VPKSPKPRRSPHAEKRADSPPPTAGASRSTTRRGGRAWSPRTPEILGPWQAAPGQLELPLATPPDVRVSADTSLKLSTEVERRTADEWYDAALDLEGDDPERATAAYRSALDLDPAHADAHLNLGRLLHEGGQLKEAEVHYRAATKADLGGASAHFNLGVVLEDQGRHAAALAAYREAIRLDQGLSSAHFNLSRLHEARGDKAEALAHLAAYRRLLTAPHPPIS
jgi:tetratricopeptide (TPR) repeat protein